MGWDHHGGNKEDEKKMRSPICCLFGRARLGRQFQHMNSLNQIDHLERPNDIPGKNSQIFVYYLIEVLYFIVEHVMHLWLSPAMLTDDACDELVEGLQHRG
jgi:hypothetical protein